MPSEVIEDRIEGDGRAAPIGELLHRITDDVKTITHDELELVRGELQTHAKAAAIDAAVLLLGGIVALIGLGLLCVVVVVALAPVIPPLWLRLLIMAVVYLVAGSLVAAAFAKRLKRDAVPDLRTPKNEAKRTVQEIRQGVRGA